MFLSETAQVADVVLAASSLAEKEGTVTNTGRRCMRINHPADASELAIRDGDQVILSSRRGEMIVPARLSEDVQPGQLFLPIYFGENSSNILINSDAYDPIAKIPEFKVSAVRIRKLEKKLA